MRTLDFATTNWLDFYSSYLDFSSPTPNPEGWISVRCPLHSDHHPSAGVNIKSGVFHCFVCGSMSPQRFLSEVLGVEAPGITPSLPKLDEWGSQPFPLGPDWENFLEAAQRNLREDLPIVQDYYRTHGITFSTLKAFGVGYVPESPNQLECLVFPYYSGGKLVALRGRSFSGLKGGIKGSHQTLYHLDALEGADRCVLVEGESDCLRAHQALGGMLPVVATPTAAFKREWERHFQGIRRIYILPQADDPSLNHLVPQVLSILGKEQVRVIPLPWRRGELGKDLVDWLRSHSDEELRNLIPDEPPRKVILTLQDLDDRAKSPVPWVVEGLLAQSDKVVIAGPQKSLKTFFALNLVRSIISGEKFLAWEIPESRRVLFIEEEGSPISFARRVQTIFSGIDGPAFWVHREGVKLDQPYWGERVDAWVEEVRPDVVVLDPLQRLHSKVEDASWEMGEVWDRIHSLSSTGRVVIVIHHFSKRAKVSQGWDALRGSGRTAGEVDVGIFIEKTPTGIRLSLDGRDLPSTETSLSIEFDPVSFRFSLPGVILTTSLQDQILQDLDDWVPIKDLVEKYQMSYYRMIKLLERYPIEFRGGVGRQPKEVRVDPNRKTLNF